MDLSEATAIAKENGFTEPDPRVLAFLEASLHFYKK
jgi:hypothetical protein